MKKKIGFIGLGQMGKWMALNLQKGGFNLTVADIDPAAVASVTAAGAATAATPAELAERADWIFLSLPNAAVVEQVLFGTNGLIENGRRGQIIVDLGTTAYMATLEFGRKLKDREIFFADSPVSGMEARAREGNLTIMFGGDQKVFKQLQPVFGALGDLILYMGELGSGQLTKLVNQLLFNISAAAIAEILPMAVKLGLDPEKVISVVNSGTGKSFAAEFFGPRILEDRFAEGYPLKHAYKDMVSAAEIGAHRKIPLPLVQAATTTYQLALAAGYGDEGKGAMIKVFENILGVKFRRKGNDG
ncbi:MAG: NAD(P)-dependent oxidoreductase [Desulfobacterales bacterium]|jgi:3-hydroxyisobutyrate dehydrogenase-like beta-hydroxyacid dehydrogenase